MSQYQVILALNCLALLLLLAQQAQRVFYRDLHAGARALVRGEYDLSRAASQRFLEQLAQRPWMRWLTWLTFSRDTRGPEVAALNLLAQADLALGDLTAARAHLEHAIALDPRHALSYHCIGLVIMRTGPLVEARPWFDKAKALGLHDGPRNRWAEAWEAAGHGAPPPNWTEPEGAVRLSLLNDDKTPMEFVVHALEHLFSLSGHDATQCMLAVHARGRAVVAAFSDRAAAEAKAAELSALAQEAGFPLACEVKA